MVDSIIEDSRKALAAESRVVAPKSGIRNYKFTFGRREAGYRATAACFSS